MSCNRALDHAHAGRRRAARMPSEARRLNTCSSSQGNSCSTRAVPLLARSVRGMASEGNPHTDLWPLADGHRAASSRRRSAASRLPWTVRSCFEAPAGVSACNGG